ncbi:MAG: recombinase family protein, partial [Acidimicrobiales bacterium]
MKRFAFYGRVSTEDQQDPESSKAWQLSRSQSLIEPAGGVVVTEYFDIGRSRSLPWKRRPESAALLDALSRSDRGFEAVVIGEPARAFYGNQFGLTFPVFAHYGVELWVPEVGGAIDPGSDAHDLVMSLYGGMSKGERNRIKIRVRAAMAAQARSEGRFLGGQPPYGYRLADAGPHPNPGKAAIGQRLHRLEPDPATTPIVRRIFEEYVSGRGLYAIAEELTRDGIPSPSAHDRARNRHRTGTAWSKMAVRAILANPRYTGRQVWNRQRRDEVLIDVDDVALGHVSKMRWNDEGEWIYSDALTHEPIVSDELFETARAIAGAGRQRRVGRTPRATTQAFALRGLITCAICNRRMQGSSNHGRAHYRCRYPSEYAMVNEVEHPRNVYVREDAIIGPLDGWLAEVFDPENIDETLDSLDAASASTDGAQLAKADAARKRMGDCDRRIARYRAALDSGADPSIVTTWLVEVRAERLAAEVELNRVTGHNDRRLTREQLAALVNGLGKLLDVLAHAAPEDKAEVYARLGLRLTYDPTRRVVIAESDPWEKVSVGEPIDPKRPPDPVGESKCRRG